MVKVASLFKLQNLPELVQVVQVVQVPEGPLKHSRWDPFGWPPGFQQNLVEDPRPFLMTQSKKRFSGILQTMSHLSDALEI